jgi:transposase-like protein
MHIERNGIGVSLEEISENCWKIIIDRGIGGIIVLPGSRWAAIARAEWETFTYSTWSAETESAFANKRLEYAYPYLFLNALTHRTHGRRGVDMTVMIAIGVDWQGKSTVIGVDAAQAEGADGWRSFLCALVTRNLHDVRYVVFAGHPGLQMGLASALPHATQQHCVIDFLDRARGLFPLEGARHCLGDLQALYDEELDEAGARVRLEAWDTKWQRAYPNATVWVSENVAPTLRYLSLPVRHQKKMRSIGWLQRLDRELEQRRLAASSIDNAEELERLVRVAALQVQEDWRHSGWDLMLDMTHLKRHPSNTASAQ